MSEMLEQLKPIAAIIGPDGVKASYSGTLLRSNSGRSGPGWRIAVNRSYLGATISFEKKAASLDDAAAAALAQLKQALGLN